MSPSCPSQAEHGGVIAASPGERLDAPVKRVLNDGVMRTSVRELEARIEGS